MILLGLDTDDSKQLEQLKQKIRSMDTDGARSLQTEISRQGGGENRFGDICRG